MGAILRPLMIGGTGRTPERVAGVALLAALLACTAPSARPLAEEPARPLLWQADRPQGGTLYLFGSIHVGVPGKADLAPSVLQAWQQSEELVVEVDASRMSQAEAMQLIMHWGALPPGQTLRSKVSPETWALVERWTAERGIPASAVEPLKPWMAAMMLELSGIPAAGLDAEYGVDNQMIGRASTRRRPIVELEGAEFQLALLDGMSAELQETYLVGTLTRLDDVENDTRRLFEIWRSGDEAALLAFLESVWTQQPELRPVYEAMIFDRNESMADKLIELAADARTRLVVVGAAHMVGPRGIPALLARRGFRVERLP